MNARIGSVPYLNARPLIYGIERKVMLCEPAQLADRLHRREFEAGLVPVAEVLTHDQYDVVDNVAIASRGPVRSVFLAHRIPLSQITRVAVDTASRTSAWLVRVILKYDYGLEPEFYPRPYRAGLGEHEALMLIGDEAIRYATSNGADPILDLGQAWRDLTGLPFVYAAWALQRDLRKELDWLPAELRQAKANGLAHLERIVQDSAEATPEFRRTYLSQNVCFDLGDQEKRGLEKFQQYLREMKLVGSSHDLRYLD